MPRTRFALLALLLVCGCRAERDVRVLRLGHGLDTTHPVHRAMESMARDVAERSEGRLQIVLYPSEQLGSERELLELLQIGSVAITKVSASVLETFSPRFRLFGIPYLFDGRQHQFDALDGPLGETLFADLGAARLHGLAWYDAGSRSFYATRAIDSPADLAGLKIRTQESPSAIRMVQALGGSATPIAWGELYTALQQGVVDGAENNPPSFYLSRHYEVARHYSLDEHTAVPDVLLFSARVWRDLEPGERNLLAGAARRSALLQRRLWQESTDDALRKLAAAGVQIHHPDQRLFRTGAEELIEEARRASDLAPLLAAVHATREGR